MSEETEIQAVIARYARRAATAQGRYEMRHPAVWQAVLERQQAIIRLLSSELHTPIEATTLLEIGCGTGMNLLEFLRIGILPANLQGNELLSDRLTRAREVLPQTVRLHPGNAAELQFPDCGFDIVFQSTVFSSLLDRQFREVLARKMWRWVKPGGAVLWYDFTYDNPANPDVRGITRAEIRALFPQARIRTQRVTLAPPISRRVTRLHPQLYKAFNVFPFLRTHVLCWIAKRG